MGSVEDFLLHQSALAGPPLPLLASTSLALCPSAALFPTAAPEQRRLRKKGPNLFEILKIEFNNTCDLCVKRRRVLPVGAARDEAREAERLRPPPTVTYDGRRGAAEATGDLSLKRRGRISAGDSCGSRQQVG